MTRARAPSILEVLRDRSIEPAPDGPGGVAAAMLRARVLLRVSDALVSSGSRALLVKGAGLALSVYRDPAARPMSDVDLLAPPGELDAVVAALAASGGEIASRPGRPETAAAFGEVPVSLRVGGLAQLVEVHSSLDKIVRRPVDLGSIFERARPAPDLPALSIPAPEDHALLVAQHAAGDELGHAVAWLDMELLFRRGLDVGAIATRARSWRLETAMFAMLAGLRELGAASIGGEHVRAFAPGRLRRAVLRRAFTVSTAPRQAQAANGLPWVLRQAMLHDDLGAWTRDVLRYARARARERGFVR